MRSITQLPRSFYTFACIRKMQNIYAYNFITLLNCAKIKAHRYSLIEDTHFYDVPFEELEELKIEDVIKRVGLYPIPFFSLKIALVLSFFLAFLNFILI